MRRFFFVFLAVLPFFCSCVAEMEKVDELPPVFPDCVDVTIPYNIAPLDFAFNDFSNPERCSRMLVVVADWNGRKLMTVRGRTARFPLGKWRRILEANKGSYLNFGVAMKIDGSWKLFKSFRMNVSWDPIDYAVTYRKIMPGYQAFGPMGIYERELSSFEERPLLETAAVDANCMNCHTANMTDPSSFSTHIRGSHSATILNYKGDIQCLDTKTDATGGNFVYPYWHPSGEYIAYSVNTTRQSFYSASDRRIEVYDEASDVIVYHPASRQIITSPLLMRKDKFETYPAFSPDGRTLYFCCADSVASMPAGRERLKYSLCCIAFDPERGEFGERVDTLLSGPRLNRSFATPRPSYDGSYLMVAVADFGTFHIWHKESDLWMLNLEMGCAVPVKPCNSDESESFHNWSSNSRWVLFVSRRFDGLYSRIFISHVDESGLCSKPFLLPQRNPAEAHLTSVYSYNVPDFASAPADYRLRRTLPALLSPSRQAVSLR